MKKLSNKIAKEIRVVEWFIPQTISHWQITDEDRLAFAVWSSYGEAMPKTDGTEALKWGKTYREVHIKMYREDILAGLLLPKELKADMPPEVYEYVMKSLNFYGF